MEETMKKALSLILAVLMLLSATLAFASCGDDAADLKGMSAAHSENSVRSVIGAALQRTLGSSPQSSKVYYLLFSC